MLFPLSQGAFGTLISQYQQRSRGAAAGPAGVEASPAPDLLGLVSRLQPWLRCPRAKLLSVRPGVALLAAMLPMVGLGILP